MAAAEEVSSVTYEELADLEHEFDDLDNTILRNQYVLSASLYAKRQALISKIPNFWALVFQSAPPEIDFYVQPIDSEIIGNCLVNLSVERFEIPIDSIENGASGGDPRSLLIRFEFPENEWFEDKILEKKFWWRRAEDGWTGLVSEPVKIHWKKGKDETKGLMEGAIRLWEARKQAGDMAKRDLPEFDALAKIVDTWNGSNTSFFTWFAFVSTRRWVSAEESARAVMEEKDRRQKTNKTEADAQPMADDDPLEQQVEVHENGDSLANYIAEDLWPTAIKYFTEAQYGSDVSDDELEDGEDMDKDQAVDEEDDEPINIRNLVSGQPSRKIDVSGSERPRKKQKK